ncbi:MAG: hypothetical protein IT427_15035 [Pirellulales bacterium]|nr:hypothetical protein [Pirellulales bacterium]
MIDTFTTDGTQLSIGYTVAGDYAPDFTIGLYASPDGVALGELLQSIPVDTTAGTRSLALTPEFADLQQDYFLMAAVDGDEQVPESDEANNALLFAGGAFVAQDAASGGKVLQYHGGPAAEAISLAVPTSGTLRLSVRDPAPMRGVPSGDVQAPYVDFTGDQNDGATQNPAGMVSQLDADALAFNLAHSDHPWQNAANRWDVDGDALVSPGDSLIIINAVNAAGPQLLARPPVAGDYFQDVSGDNVVSMLDARRVLDKLNGGSGDVGSLWRNPTNPLDVNNDGKADVNDQFAILAYLDSFNATATDYALSDLLSAHLRAHDGNNRLAANIPSNNALPLWLIAGNGDNALQGSTGDDYLSAGDGADTLMGESGDDILTGNGGNDDLRGGDGNDVLYGGDGEDILDGGPGANNEFPDGPPRDGTAGDYYFGPHYIFADFDWWKIMDAQLDMRRATATLVDLTHGITMTDFADLHSDCGTPDGDGLVIFPIFSANIDYTLTVTVSAGLSGGGTISFNSSRIYWNGSSNHMFMFDIVSTDPGYNWPNSVPPDGWTPDCAGGIEYPHENNPPVFEDFVEPGEAFIYADGEVIDELDGSVIGQLSATDADSQGIVYSLASTSAFFNVNRDGTIQIADAKGLAKYAETHDSLNIPVMASDGVTAIEAQFVMYFYGPPNIPYQRQVRVITTNGQTFSPTSGAEFFATLQDLKTRGQKVSYLIIKGHAGNAGEGLGGMIQLGSADDIFTAPPNNVTQNFDIQITDGPRTLFITQLMKDVMAPGSTISFRGCSATELSKNTAKALPGVKVYGGFIGQIGIPGTPYSVGPYKGPYEW